MTPMAANLTQQSQSNVIVATAILLAQSSIMQGVTMNAFFMLPILAVHMGDQSITAGIALK